MNNPPDAWDDEWSTAADTLSAPTEQEEPKKQSSKVSKAQRRAQQAEFNRQLWAEAEGPRETNYFLEARNVVHLRSEFKPPPVLLSRKGPPIIQSRKPPAEALNDLDLDKKAVESSEDEDEVKSREKTLAARQAQAAKDREEKQRKYDERRQELFGTPSTASGASTSSGLNNIGSGCPTSRSGHSTPNSNTPPGSRSATPNRGGRGRGRGRGGRDSGNPSQSRNQQRQQQPTQQSQQELFDPGYAPMPESVHQLRRESPQNMMPKLEQPIRAPKGPDGSGRGGFGFAHKSGKAGGDAQP